MSSKRIIIVCRRYCPGEAWTNRILAYAKGFVENGAEVVLVYLVCDKQRSFYDISIKGVSVVNLWQTDRWLAKRNRKLSYIINILRLKSILKDGDIVFTYGYETFLMMFLTHINKNIRVFSEITEHPYVIYTRGKNKRNVKLQNHLLRKLDGLFVITEQLRTYFLSVGIPDNRIHIINMFVDVDRFMGMKSEMAEKYIGYCGTVSFYKDGVDTLIKAFANFVKGAPNYKLYIIGGFESPSIETQTHEIIKQLSIQDKVIFTGRVSPDSMPKLLINASILALTRPNNIQSQNGFPTKLGEYLATGNPVVVSRVGEIPQFIIHQKNGFLCEPDNVDSVVEQLSWIVSHNDEAKHIGACGKELCYNEFSSTVQTKNALKTMTL